MNENDENIDPVRDPVPDIDKIHVEIAEKFFGLDALEGENFDGLRDRYAESLREELEEELRRDLEMSDEDEDDFFDIDAMEPPEPRPLHEPFRHPYTKYGNIGRWRRQDVAQRVGGKDQPIFEQMGDPGLARRELSTKCLSPNFGFFSARFFLASRVALYTVDTVREEKEISLSAVVVVVCCCCCCCSPSSSSPSLPLSFPSRLSSQFSSDASTRSSSLCGRSSGPWPCCVGAAGWCPVLEFSSEANSFSSLTILSSIFFFSSLAFSSSSNNK